MASEANRKRMYICSNWEVISVGRVYFYHNFPNRLQGLLSWPATARGEDSMDCKMNGHRAQRMDKHNSADWKLHLIPCHQKRTSGGPLEQALQCRTVETARAVCNSQDLSNFMNFGQLRCEVVHAVTQLGRSSREMTLFSDMSFFSMSKK